MYSVDENIEQIDQDSELEDNLDPLQDTEDITQENEDEAEEANDGAENASSTKVEPKAKRKLGSRPKLDAERLKGPRGLICMEKMFSDLKFKGPGHEKHDLNQVMTTLQYWCHRLFPKFTFDDSLAQLEKLGYKKPVITLKKKILYDMVVDLPPKDLSDVEDGTESQQEAINEFDMLLNQEPIPTSLTPTQPAVTAKVVELSEEQKEMIARNRQLAAERRQAKLEAMKQKEAENTPMSQESQTSNPPSLNLTEEQRLIIENNRLLAIEKRRQLKDKSTSQNIEQKETETSYTANVIQEQNESEMEVGMSQETNSRSEMSSQILDPSAIEQKSNNFEMDASSCQGNESQSVISDGISIQDNVIPQTSEMEVDISQEINSRSEMSSQITNLDPVSEISNLTSKHNSQSTSEMDVDHSLENNLSEICQDSKQLSSADVFSKQENIIP